MEVRAEFLSERVADLLQRRRNERVARAACQAWFGLARQMGQGRENLRLAELWWRRKRLKSVLMRWGYKEREAWGFPPARAPFMHFNGWSLRQCLRYGRIQSVARGDGGTDQGCLLGGLVHQTTHVA